MSFVSFVPGSMTVGQWHDPGLGSAMPPTPPLVPTPDPQGIEPLDLDTLAPTPDPQGIEPLEDLDVPAPAAPLGLDVPDDVDERVDFNTELDRARFFF
jgi:hypothetical protein